MNIKIIKTIKIICLCILSTLLFSCGLTKNINKEGAPIEDTYWKLKELYREELTLTEEQKQDIYFSLKSREKVILGKGECNVFFGDYELEGENRINLLNMGFSLKNCPRLKESDFDFLSALEETETYQMDNKILYLKDKKGKVIAKFEVENYQN